MHLLEEALFLFFAFLDLEFTKHKIADHGIEVELNPVIRCIVRKLGLEWGAGVGVIVPTLAFACFGWFHPELLAFMLGIRTTLFLFQLRGYGQ